MTAPVEAPENVVAHYPDGSTIPLELTYRGVDDAGLHEWCAVVELGCAPESVTVAKLPPRTTVTFWAGGTP